MTSRRRDCSSEGGSAVDGMDDEDGLSPPDSVPFPNRLRELKKCLISNASFPNTDFQNYNTK